MAAEGLDLLPVAAADGSYVDDGSGDYFGPGDEGVWTISPPVKYTTRLAGSGRVSVKVNPSATRPTSSSTSTT